MKLSFFHVAKKSCFEPCVDSFLDLKQKFDRCLASVELGLEQEHRSPSSFELLLHHRAVQVAEFPDARVDRARDVAEIPHPSFVLIVLCLMLLVLYRLDSVLDLTQKANYPVVVDLRDLAVHVLDHFYCEGSLVMVQSEFQDDISVSLEK